MTQLRLLSVIILSGALMGCAGPKQEKTYLQAYGYQGGRGQGFVAAPFRVSQEGHACVSGKVSGRITRLRVESLSPDLEPGLAVAVQTADQGLVHVHVGPLAFLQKREADLKPGDEVAIQALCYDLAGKERLIASQIEHQGQALKLSDAEGTPFWRTMCPPAD